MGGKDKKNQAVVFIISVCMVIVGIPFFCGGCIYSGQAKARKCIIECHIAGVIPGRSREYEKMYEQSGQESEPGIEAEPADEVFVRVKDYIPDIYVDLKYATADNFTGAVIYDFQDAYLRYGTVRRLNEVQEEVKRDGYSLKIWDGFRPVSAQFKLWEICPDSRYVANPNTGYSSHSKGNTVDITLVGRDGAEIMMPTGFDDFSAMADRNYSDCSEEAARNAEYLENVMLNHGFVPYDGEWWHFADEDSYAVEEVFLSGAY